MVKSQTSSPFGISVIISSSSSSSSSNGGGDSSKLVLSCMGIIQVSVILKSLWFDPR